MIAASSDRGSIFVAASVSTSDASRKIPHAVQAMTPATSREITASAPRMPIASAANPATTPADTSTSEPVTIVNHTTAKRYWPDQDPVGKRIRFGSGANNTNPWITIVGVVADTKRAGLDLPVFTESYRPVRQSPTRDLDVLVRARADAASGLAPVIRAAVREIDPDQPVSSIAPLPEILDQTVASRRFNTLLMTVFAVAALLLAAMGVYGLLAYVMWAEMRNEPHVSVGYRRIPAANQRQALTVALLGVGLVVGATFTLLALTDAPLDRVLFEVISAFGTVGLSTGFTAVLPTAGQLILVALMFLGRTGPLTVAAALALREHGRRYTLPEERTIVG